MVNALIWFFFFFFYKTCLHLCSNDCTIIIFGMLFDRLLCTHFGGFKLLKQTFFRFVRRAGGSESRDGLSADRA